ncbi:MAG: hypothetical protein QM571_07025 [Micrococcaceae bacterium]
MQNNFSRRNLVKGSVWSVPVVATAVAAPACAASDLPMCSDLYLITNPGAFIQSQNPADMQKPIEWHVKPYPTGRLTVAVAEINMLTGEIKTPPGIVQATIPSDQYIAFDAFPNDPGASDNSGATYTPYMGNLYVYSVDKVLYVSEFTPDGSEIVTFTAQIPQCNNADGSVSNWSDSKNMTIDMIARRFLTDVTDPPTTYGLSPNESATLSFQLKAGSEPSPNENISFTVHDLPDNSIINVTPNPGVTDANGITNCVITNTSDEPTLLDFKVTAHYVYSSGDAEYAIHDIIKP